MKDQGPNGIKPQLKAVYVRILEKVRGAGRSVSMDMTRELCRDMDSLVMNLNKVIEEAVSEAYAEHGGQQVHDIDVNGRFNTHRWCEKGDWHEPAAQVDTTWFFLSGWPDVSIDGSPKGITGIEMAEVKTLIDAGRIPVPDANCRLTLDSDADPYLRAMCYLAEAVASKSSSVEAKLLDRANTDLQNGFRSTPMGYFHPTRQRRHSIHQVEAWRNIATQLSRA